MQNYRSSLVKPARRLRLKIWAVSAVIMALMIANGSASKASGPGDYSQGKTALRSGDYGKAIQFFEAALNDKANIEESQAGLLCALRETGDYKGALNRARQFLSARSGSAVLELELGRLLSLTGAYPEAEKHLRQSVALAPAKSTLRLDAITELCELLEGVGRKSDAHPLWDQILDAYRAGAVKGSQALGDVALAAWGRGYYKDSNNIFIDATDPKTGEVSLETLTNFGYKFLETYDFKQALGVFRDVLKINKSHPRAMLGVALAKKYDSDIEVEIHAQAALKVNPGLVGAWNALAVNAMEEENYAEALDFLRQALSVNAASLDSLALEAFCLYAQGDKPAFNRIEKQVTAINPHCGAFYHILAENLVSRRKYQEAVDWSRKAIALDPELWPAYVTLGMNLTRVGELEEGRRAIDRAFEGDPYNVWAYNMLDLFDRTIDKFVQSKSEHFTFRMSKEDSPALSSYALELAEEVYAKLTQRYGFKPNGPLHVEIFPDHGGFAVRTLGLPGLSGALGVCFGKVVAMNSPRDKEAGVFNWGATLWHEFAHVITLQMTNYNIPRWFSEGISVHEERRARPGWGDNLTYAFLQAYKSGKVMKASELNAGFVRPKSPEQIMFAYYQSALICEMIEEKYGFDKIRQALLLFSENKPAEEVFRQTLGLTASQMDAEYGQYIDSRFRSIAAHIPAPKNEEQSAAEAFAPPDKNALIRQLDNAPDDFGVNLRLGTLLRKEGALVEAEARLKKAEQLFPQFVEAGNPYEVLGQMYLEQKREDEALAQFKAWIRQDGDARDPLLRAAEIYRHRKDWVSAADVLNLSVFINPYDEDVLGKLGEAAVEAEKWPIAISAYRTMTGMSISDQAGAHYNLARALLASGDRSEARREVLKSLEIAPQYREAQGLLLKLSGEQK